MSVIVLLADGARADTLSSAIDGGSLPAMQRLREEGTLREVTSAFPSVTGPAYAPFLMGRFPGPVGLPGLRWFDRARQTCTFPDYSRSYVGYQMGALDGDLDPNSPTIFELVPDSIAALSVITRGLPRSRQLASLSLKSAFRAASTHFRGNLAGWLDVDRDVGSRVIERVRTAAPSYVFAAFTGVDKMSHARGHAAEGIQEALEIVDGVVAELRALLERTGAWKDTHLWITSDHGHSPVAQHEDLEYVVRDLGYRVMAHPWVIRFRPEVAVMVSGNAMAHLYVELDRRDRPFRAALQGRWHDLIQHLLARESVDLVLVPEDENRCVVLSRTRGEAIVTRRSAGKGYGYLRAGTGDPLGLGRDLTDLSDAAAHDATLGSDYPDALVQIAEMAASPRCGDIMLSASRLWDFRARYEPIPHVSSHGALHRDHMLVPLLMNRAPTGTPRRTTDLMPSALRALGRPVPSGLDGSSFI
jgi:hypothetical protein